MSVGGGRGGGRKPDHRELRREERAWVSTSLRSCHEGQREAAGKRSGITPRLLLISAREESPLIRAAGERHECIQRWNTREKGNWPPWSWAGEELKLQEERRFGDEMKGRTERTRGGQVARAPEARAPAAFSPS